jgi:phosphomannomutase
VGAGGFQLGLANDGDADRIAAVDEHGRFFSPQRILAVLLRHLWETKGHRGDAAKAVNGTCLLDRLAQGYGCRVHQTPIGFKHMGEVMLARPVVLAGEESGGIGVGAHLPERDGLLTALLLAEIVASAGKGLRAYLQEIFDRVGYFTYRRLDLSLSPPEAERVRGRIAEAAVPAALGEVRVADVEHLDGLKLTREDGSWVLVRPSGTEPLLRIYAEARSPSELAELLAAGRELSGLG